jgi:hypothetical protein
VIGRLVVTSNNPWLAVHSDDPSIISWLSLDGLPPDAKVQEIALDAAERNRVIEDAAKLLDRLYVFPEVGKKISAALGKCEGKGRCRVGAHGGLHKWYRCRDPIREYSTVIDPCEAALLSPADSRTQHGELLIVTR